MKKKIIYNFYIKAQKMIIKLVSMKELIFKL